MTQFFRSNVSFDIELIIDYDQKSWVGFWLFPMMISFPACEGLHQVQSKEKKPQKRKIFFFLCWSRICGSINQSLPKCGLLLRYHYQSRTSTQSTAQWRSTSFTIQDNLFVSPKLITISCVR